MHSLIDLCSIKIKHHAKQNQNIKKPMHQSKLHLHQLHVWF